MLLFPCSGFVVVFALVVVAVDVGIVCLVILVVVLVALVALVALVDLIVFVALAL